jgi:hypothetical protein
MKYGQKGSEIIHPVGAELEESRMYAYIGPLQTVDAMPDQIIRHGRIWGCAPTAISPV